MKAVSLKSQDVFILIKLCGYRSASRPSYSLIASEIHISGSEINAAIKRLQTARLVLPNELNELPIMAAVEEFLIHGVKYSFPAVRGSWVRGMPTSYATEPLKSQIVIDDDPIPVWPDPKGTVRGLSLIPLYRSVPDACREDPVLYGRLALLDAIRSGGTRERKLAEKELINNLRQTHDKS